MEPSTDRPVALITGASRGIGAATARLLASKGYALVLAARSDEALDALGAELDALGARTLVVPTDMCRPDDVRHLAQHALDHFGKVDVLINNAGVALPGITIARLTDEDTDTVLTTNLVAPVHLTRLLLPAMLARRSGTIIFVSSIGGHIGLPSGAMYSTTKFGLRGFATALRREVAPQGVNVVIVSPSFIRTRLTEPIHAAMPLLRMKRPEIVARAIVASISRHRREIVIPRYFSVILWLEWVFPGVGDAVLGMYMQHFAATVARRFRPSSEPPSLPRRARL